MGAPTCSILKEGKKTVLKIINVLEEIEDWIGCTARKGLFAVHNARSVLVETDTVGPSSAMLIM